MVLTYRVYEQIAITFRKDNFNSYLYEKYQNCSCYIKNNNSHIYSNNFEYTKLVITNTNLKIKSNVNNPIFFKDINDFYDNIFICDFINKDYFWLDKIIKKDRQNLRINVK